MRTVTYASVLSKVAKALGQPDGLSQEDGAIANYYINLRVKQAWEFYVWPDLRETEFRRLDYPWWDVNNGGYDAGDEVLHRPTNRVYRALQSTSTEPGGVGTPWLKLTRPWTGEEWSSTHGDYTLAEVVFNPTDGEYYACILAAGSGTFAPGNATYWVELSEFTPEFDPDDTSNGQTVLGDVIEVWDQDPRRFDNANLLNFTIDPAGILVDNFPASAWFVYRRKVPDYDGDAWDSAETYAAGERVYFGSDFYTCLATTTAGQSPTTTPAKWELIEFPYIFGNFTAQSAFADMENRIDGKPELYGMESAAGYALLAQELDRIERQQGQITPLTVKTLRRTW